VSKKIPRIVKPIFISVDPSRDTVGQIRHYAKDFHKSFVFLTGTKDMVAAATKVYRVYFSKVSVQQLSPSMSIYSMDLLLTLNFLYV
jgi:cytochrome oxidase Cu insertion factor (SCO1/SenC/PrrC family)